MNLLEAIDRSIKHWEENCVLAERGELARDGIYSESCALCSFVRGRYNPCSACPLYWFGMWCEITSPWRDVCDATMAGLDALEEAEIMLQCLVLVRLAVVDFFYGGKA